MDHPRLTGRLIDDRVFRNAAVESCLENPEEGGLADLWLRESARLGADIRTFPSGLSTDLVTFGKGAVQTD
jgi:hypothetical protein